jgi:hypothetical protein
LGKEKIVSRRHHGQGTVDVDSPTPLCGRTRERGSNLGNDDHSQPLRHAYSHLRGARLAALLEWVFSHRFRRIAGSAAGCRLVQLQRS